MKRFIFPRVKSIAARAVVAIAVLLLATVGVRYALAQPPSYTISIEKSKYVGEGQGSVTVTVKLNAKPSEIVTVQFALAAGTATADDDYKTKTNPEVGTLTFYANDDEIEKTITIDIVNDSESAEGNEYFYVELSGESSNATISTAKCTVTVIDDDNGSPSIQFVNAAESESENVGSIKLTLTLSDMAATPVTVKYATKDEDAKAGIDYVKTEGELTFAVGETSTITIPILDDIIAEDLKVFRMKLSNLSGASEGWPFSVDIDIMDDDPEPPTVYFDMSTYSFNEDEGAYTVYVMLSSAALAPVTVKYTTKDGSAKAGADYLETAGTLTFSIGVTSQSITIPILNDTAPESSETFTLELSDFTWGTEGYPSSAELTIEDDDEPPPVVPVTVVATGGTFSPDPAPIGTWVEVTLNAKATRPDPGTATLYCPDWDWKVVDASYSEESETGSWSGGDKCSYVASIDPTSAPSPDGTYDYSAVVLSACFHSGTYWQISSNAQVAYADTASTAYVGAAIAQGKGETQPTISGGGDEAAENSRVLQFWFKLSAPSKLPITVEYQTMDDKATFKRENGKDITLATAYDDYLPAKGVLTFLPGEKTKLINVVIIHDSIKEDKEWMIIKSSNPTNAGLAPGDMSMAFGRIVDSPSPTKPDDKTEIYIDPISSPAYVDPSGPINQIHNPAGIVIESTPTFANVSLIKATVPSGIDVSQLVWTIKNADLKTGDDDNDEKVRAEFFSKPTEWNMKKDEGDFVYIYGKNEGRIRLEVLYKDDEGKKVRAKYEALVVKNRNMKVRINLLKGTEAGSGTSVTPELATLHLKAANVYMRQAGVFAVQDDEQTAPKTIKDVKMQLVKNPNSALKPDEVFEEILNLNSRDEVVQINYLQGLSNALGLCLARPGNDGFADAEMPKADKIKYLITFDEVSDSPMNTIGARTYKNAKSWGILIPNASYDKNGMESSSHTQGTFGNTLAHELGHIMNLLHRDPESNISDGLGVPTKQNMMGFPVHVPLERISIYSKF